MFIFLTSAYTKINTYNNYVLSKFFIQINNDILYPIFVKTQHTHHFTYTKK